MNIVVPGINGPFASHAPAVPSLGSPADISRIMEGTWTSLPEARVESVCHRLDAVDQQHSNFLFAPELFAKSGGNAARRALLAAPHAASQGAIGILCTQRPRNLDTAFPCLIVSDVSQAIARLASFNRRRSQATFFAVTGSVGKSTTRNMIHALCAAIAPAQRSRLNYNDGLASVSFSLSNLSPDHRYFVAEFSEVGEIDAQLQLFRPHISVITNVLWEHVARIERQGLEGHDVLKRLIHLTAAAARNLQPGGTCVIDADQENFRPLLDEVRRTDGIRIATFGRDPACTVRIHSINAGSNGSDIEIEASGKRFSYRLGMPGHHMAINSVAAAAAVHSAGIPLGNALHVFSNLTPERRRGAVIRLPWKGGDLTIRDETVSSSLPSLRSSFEQLALESPEPCGRRIAVLGQVSELGRDGPSDMSNMAKLAEAMPIDHFYTIGSDIRFFNEAFGDRSRISNHFQTLDQLEKALRDELRAGDLVVFKSTRTPKSISMRRLLDRFVAQAGHPVSQSSRGCSSATTRRIVVGGDTYFGEYYQEKREKLAEVNYLERLGYDYSSARIAPLFRRADFAVVNLECALTDLENSQLDGRKDYILRGNPEKTLKALRNLNVEAVLLGNNHSMDYLEPGLRETLNHLREEGLQYSGAGAGRLSAQNPILKEVDVDGISFRLAIVSGYEFNEGYERLGYYAGDSRLGVNNINIDRLRRQIRELRERGFFVIVSPHWGENYCFRDHSQTRLANRIVDSGADLVIGHGPHMMNEIGWIGETSVIYSLGNLVFNSEGEYERRGVAPYSLIAELELARAGHGLTCALNLYPIVSCNQMTQFQPCFVNELQFEQVWSTLQFMHYDPEEFRSRVCRRTLEGRQCMTLRVF